MLAANLVALQGLVALEALRVGVKFAELTGQPLNFCFSDDRKSRAEIGDFGPSHTGARHKGLSWVAKEIVRADFRFSGAPQTEAVFAVPEFGEAECAQSENELLNPCAVSLRPTRWSAATRSATLSVAPVFGPMKKYGLPASRMVWSESFARHHRHMADEKQNLAR